MGLAIAIVCLCVVGAYASLVMWRKAGRAARGELTERSVVQSDRARTFGGTPNAALGLAYYAALIIATPLFAVPAVYWPAFAAALAAAAFSAYLAYSLLFVTRMPCVYCWTSHVVNWLLVALIFAAHTRS